MRDLKFRAWFRDENSSHKKMHYGVTDFTERQDFYVMQYTGLNDKNGKEIYEGDIIVLGGKYPKKKTPQIIGYDAGYLSYGIVYDTGEMMRKLTPLEMVKGIEVIGNVYENKEML